MDKIRILITWLLGTLGMSAMAQEMHEDYRPMAQDGNKWEMQVGIIMECIYTHYIDGDTVIGGKSWKKVYNTFWGTAPSYYSAIRDEGRKVYAIAKGSTKPRLLYDFGLKKGDKVKCGMEGTAFQCLIDKGEQPDTLYGFPQTFSLRLESIDTIEVRGTNYRRLTFKMLDALGTLIMNTKNGDLSFMDDIVWIEGIGSCYGPFSPWQPLLPQGVIYQKYMKNNTTIFDTRDFYTGNDTNTINDFEYPNSTGKETKDKAYDLQGRRLMDKPQKGVYIKDGRKYVK